MCRCLAVTLKKIPLVSTKNSTCKQDSTWIGQKTPAARGQEELFSRCFQKVSPAHSRSAFVVQEFGWQYKQTISNFLRIFLLNPNFLFAHRNRYSEGTDDGQITLPRYPNFNIYVKNLHVLVFRMDGQTDRWTDGQTEKLFRGRLGNYVPPG